MFQILRKKIGAKSPLSFTCSSLIHAHLGLFVNNPQQGQGIQEQMSGKKQLNLNPMNTKNSPLRNVSRRLKFQGSSTLPKVLGGSVMTLVSCRGVVGLEKVTPVKK